MCNALQHTLKQRNTTDDFYVELDVAHVSDFEIMKIEEKTRVPSGTKKEWKLCGVSKLAREIT